MVSKTSSSLLKIGKRNDKNNSQRMLAVCIWTFYNFTVVWIRQAIFKIWWQIQISPLEK
jgi:hypothetical protein